MRLCMLNKDFSAQTVVFFQLPYFDNLDLFDLILYVPSTIFQLNRDRSSQVEPVLS